jgi:4-hydroxythreonine-4-phosphate dehydrogenase
MVTGPICKESAAKAGFSFPGHTEFIAHLTGTKDFVMMLGGPDLKVALVTIHVPLKSVARLITRAAVGKTIKITNDAFKRYFIKKPKIAVAGLNPHAGEGGLFGDEEIKAIEPAVKRARRLGMNVTGPIAADTVFYRAAVKKEFDCVIAMYHDQGLGPLKLAHFDDGVNVTLGLPIIRTSVDHGTAYDIAGTGAASAESMIAAIVTAAEMAKKNHG